MKWATETQGTRGETDFFTLSAQFPLYFLPEDPCLQNVQSMLSVDRLWNLPEQKKMKKEERERVTLLPPSCAVLQNDGIIIQKNLLPYFFHFFIPEFPEHWATIITRILGPHTPVTRSDVGREENTNALFAKCIWLYFCPESCLIGVHVRKSMVDCGWGSATSSVRTPGFPSLHLLKHMSGL